MQSSTYFSWRALSHQIKQLLLALCKAPSSHRTRSSVCAPQERLPGLQVLRELLAMSGQTSTQEPKATTKGAMTAFRELLGSKGLGVKPPAEGKPSLNHSQSDKENKAQLSEIPKCISVMASLPEEKEEIKESDEFEETNLDEIQEDYCYEKPSYEELEVEAQTLRILASELSEEVAGMKARLATVFRRIQMDAQAEADELEA